MMIRVAHVVVLLAAALGLGAALPASVIPDAGHAAETAGFAAGGAVRADDEVGVPLRYFVASCDGSVAVAALLYTGYPVRVELLGSAAPADGRDVSKQR
jgi:hypothetical protein